MPGAKIVEPGGGRRGSQVI